MKRLAHENLFLLPILALLPSLLLQERVWAEPKPPSEWHQWRGPTRDGRLPASAKATWPDSLKVEKLWSAEVGESYASPIVSGELVFSVETKDKEDEVVRAFDRDGGEQRWESTWPGSMKVPFFAAKNGSWVRSTPAFDGESLYVGGMLDVLVCLDAKTGKERWRVDFPEREGSPAPGFGYVSSPLVEGNFLYVQAGSAIIKLDKRSGKEIWSTMKDARAMYGSAFSSPVIRELHGVRQLIAQTRTRLAGIDLSSGDVLWDYEIKAFRGMNILTPTVIGGKQIFTSTYGGGSFLFDIARDGNQWRASKKWVNKIEGYMASPDVIGSHIYLHGRDRRYHCIDTETGEQAWQSKEKFGEYWSTVTNGDKILALDERGELLLVEANPKELKILDRTRVSKSPTWAHLAIAGDEIYVRELRGLKKFRWLK